MVPVVSDVNTLGYLGCQCALVDTITHSIHFGPTIFIMRICKLEPRDKDTVLTQIQKNLGQLYGEFTVHGTNLETHKLINDPDPPQAAVSFLPCKIKLKKMQNLIIVC